MDERPAPAPFDERRPFTLPGQIPAEGLVCPRCDCRHFEVTHTWRVGDEIRRRRKCRNCGRPIQTVEVRLRPDENM